MGIPGMVWYFEDLGSAIEAAEKVIAKIKTNKYDKKDVILLEQALAAIVKFINEDKDSEDKD